MKEPEKDTFKKDLDRRIYRSDDEGLDEFIDAYEKKAHVALISFAFLAGAATYAIIHHFLVH